MTPIAETKSKPKPPRPQDLELESIRIEPADNGYTVIVHKRLKRTARGMDYDYPEPDRAVFTDYKEMLRHIASKFGLKVK